MFLWQLPHFLAIAWMYRDDYARAGMPMLPVIDRDGAIAWLEKYAMYTKPRAEQRLRFIDQYRSYVINYNLGKDLVRAYVEYHFDRPLRAWAHVPR